MVQSAEVVAKPVDRTGIAAWLGYPWIVLVASLLVQTSSSFGIRGISPLAAFLVDDLQLSRNQVGLVITAGTLGTTLVLILAGNLSDRFGVRKLFVGGLLLAGLPLMAGSFAPSYAWLLVAIAISGMGMGFALPPTTRAIVDWFPANRRGLPMGIKQTGLALAGVICGFSVPPLSMAFGWRGALLALGTVSVVCGLIAWSLYRDRPADRTPSGGRQRASFRGVARNRNLVLLSGVTWLYAAVQLSVLGFLVLYLHERIGLSTVEAGVLLALAEGCGVVGRVGWGVVSDLYFGSRRRVEMGIIGLLAAGSLLLLAQIGPGTPYPILLALLAVFGVSGVGWNGINMVFVSEIVERQSSATAAGFNLTASYLGVMLGPPLFGLVVDATGSYAMSLQLGAVACLVALILLSQMRPIQKERV
jgi:MFS transporter, ACS family, hexuronate transporter